MLRIECHRNLNMVIFSEKKEGRAKEGRGLKAEG